MAGVEEDGARATVRAIVWRAGFACALLGVLVLSLLPLDEPPPINTGWDKTDHLFAYMVLALLGLQAFASRLESAVAHGLIPPTRERRMLLGLLAFGAAVELLQGLTETRQTDWRDVLANSLGIALGWLVWSVWNARRIR